MTPEAKLVQLGTTLIRVRAAISHLDDRYDDADLSDSERDGIALQLPTLRADRAALEAKFLALSANVVVLGSVSDSVYGTLKTATDELAKALANRQATSVVLGMVSNVIDLARKAVG